MNIRDIFYHWAIFKRGYSESSYAANVIQFVMLLTMLLIVSKVAWLIALFSFLGVFSVIFISSQLIYLQNALPSESASLEKTIELTSFWMLEPLDEARKRVLRK